MSKIVHFAKAVLSTSLKVTLRKVMEDFRERSFRPYIKKKNVEGVIFDFYVGDRSGRDWYDLHCTDPVWAELRFIRDHLLREGDVVLECGAHHGCTTAVLSHWVGDKGKVVAFEPVPKNCDIIRRQIELNNLTNIVLESKAVGAAIGKTTITGSSNSSIVSSSKPGIQVELTCLDQYAHLNPSLLKIDVEGFEVEVLRGASKVLSKRPKLAIEIHTDALGRYNSSVEDVFNLIAPDEYELWVQWEDGEEPIEYSGKSPPITSRVHLFGFPRKPMF